MRVLTVFLLLAGLASADTFLIKSTDGGRTWIDIDPGPPHQLLRWFRVDPGTSNLYALTRRDLGAEGQLLALMVSTDGGQTWQARQNFPREASWNILPAGPVSPDTLYLAYREPGFPLPKSVVVARVSDGGQTVEQYPAQGLTIEQPPAGIGSTYASLVGLDVNPAAPSTLYALITNEYADDIYAFFQALWRSDDGGRNWSRLEPPVKANCGYPEFRIDPSGSPMYLLCDSDVFKTTDGGDSWTQKAGPDAKRIWNLHIGPGAPGTLYGTQLFDMDSRVFDLWKSTDAAETWQRSGSLPFGAGLGAVHPTKPSVILATTRDGISRSDDSGETWTTVTERPFLAEFSPSIVVDPHAPDTLYAHSFLRQELRLHDRQTFLRNLMGEKQVAPGSLVSIYGQDLARETRVAASAPLPLSLGGASVLFNGQPAPLLFVSPGQINAHVPFGLAPVTWPFPPTNNVIMEVRRADGSSDRQTVGVSPNAVVILRENSTRESAPLLFHASDFRPVTPEDPARRGEAITLFALGMGELEPSIASGELPPTPAPQLPNPPCVEFTVRPGGPSLALAPPLSAGAAPGMIGVYQVNFEIPASLSAASFALSLTGPRSTLPANGRECIPGYRGLTLDSVMIEVH